MTFKAGEDRKNSFIKYFSGRVMNNNKNFLCAVTGQTGSGKSWLTGSIGEQYRELTGMPFDPKEHTIFSLKELMKIITSEDEATRERIKPCTFLHFDEPQVSTNSRDWQSESNKILNTLTSTFRNMRLVILFATPYLEFLDKQTRILFHAEIKVNGFDKTTGLTLCQPRLLEWAPHAEQFYRKRLIINYFEEQKKVPSWYYLQNWEVKKPSKAWIDVYEPMKADFTRKLNLELANRLEFGKGGKKEAKDGKGKSNGISDVIEAYEKTGGNFLEIAKLLPNMGSTSLMDYYRTIKATKNLQRRMTVPSIAQNEPF